VDPPPNAALIRSVERSSSNRGKHVKFIRTLEPTIDEVNEPISPRVDAYMSQNRLQRPFSPVEARSSSPSLESDSSSDGPTAMYRVRSKNRVPSSNTSVDSVASGPSRGTFLHMDSYEAESDHPSFQPISKQTPPKVEVRQKKVAPIAQVRHRTKKSSDSSKPATRSRSSRSRTLSPNDMSDHGDIKTFQTQEEMISPFQRDPFSYAGTMSHFQPLSPSMLGVIPDSIPETLASPPPAADKFPSRNWAIPPTPLKRRATSSRGSSSSGSPATNDYSNFDFPSYSQDTRAKPKPAKRSKLSFLRKIF
jgi:hypothetical protein